LNSTNSISDFVIDCFAVRNARNEQFGRSSVCGHDVNCSTATAAAASTAKFDILHSQELQIVDAFATNSCRLLDVLRCNFPRSSRHVLARSSAANRATAIDDLFGHSNSMKKRRVEGSTENKEANERVVQQDMITG